MSRAERIQPERTLRWAELPSTGVEFKCGGCGHWSHFVNATELKAGDAYICKTCANALLAALEAK